MSGAIDASGKAQWFVAPNVAAFTDFWFAEPVPAPNFGFMGDWRKSLVERPGKSFKPTYSATTSTALKPGADSKPA